MTSIILALIACANPEKPVLVGDSLASCTYTSAFSKEVECRDYFDADLDYATADCLDKGSALQVGEACEAPLDEMLGSCTWDDGDTTIVATVLSTDADKCGSNKFGCNVFAKGYWEASPLCTGLDEIAVYENPFPQPVQVCSDPLDGEPGMSEDGQVCTWNIVSGATEPGRDYSDYVSCDNVIAQRGYAPVKPNPLADEPDARLDDPEYVADVDWVRSELRSGSCVCCHASTTGRDGAVFDVDFSGNLLNQFNDRGLAMGAGWIPTIGFGTYAPEDNNGHWRSSPENPNLSIIPTIDVDRMIRIFERELDDRGLVPDDFEGDTYGAGPLDEQRVFVPEACSEEEGVSADGTIRWLPGRARYVYVLEADATSPTIPPNLDLPEGTLWRIDVPEDGDPVASRTVVYGEVPNGMTQRFPASGTPEPLVAGRQYYLYAAADVLYPISRCLFVAGEPDPTEASGGCDTAPGTGAAAALALLVLLGRRRR